MAGWSILVPYWSGFATWLVGRVDRRWTRSAVEDRLCEGALDVGTALVGARSGVAGAYDAVWLALDRLEWLVGVAAGAGRLSAAEHAHIAEVLATTRTLLPRTHPRRGGADPEPPAPSASRSASGTTTTHEATPPS